MNIANIRHTLETIIRKCYTVTVDAAALKEEPSGAKYKEGLKEVGK